MCVFVSVAGVIFTYVGRYAHAVLHTCTPHLHTDCEEGLTQTKAHEDESQVKALFVTHAQPRCQQLLTSPGTIQVQ